MELLFVLLDSMHRRPIVNFWYAVGFVGSAFSSSTSIRGAHPSNVKIIIIIVFPIWFCYHKCSKQRNKGRKHELYSLFNEEYAMQIYMEKLSYPLFCLN